MSITVHTAAKKGGVRYISKNGRDTGLQARKEGKVWVVWYSKNFTERTVVAEVPSFREVEFAASRYLDSIGRDAV